MVDDADFLTSALDSYLNDQIVPDESGNVGDLNKPDDDDFFGNEEEDTAVKPLSTGDEHQNNEILDLEIVEDESQAQEIIFESKSLQVAYVPVSQLSLPETMLPADQAILIKQAQDNQIKKILLLAEVNHELQNLSI